MRGKADDATACYIRRADGGSEGAARRRGLHPAWYGRD